MKEIKNKNILVTGGLGFVGSNLALRLHNLGANITLTDINTKNLYRLSPKEDSFLIKETDITDNSQVEQMIENYDIIFHLAAQTSHAFSMKKPQVDSNINIIGTLNLLEAIKNNNSKAKLVFTSTKGVTGIPLNLPVNEETTNKPLDVYSANKLLTEEYCKIYQHHYDLDFTILRLTNVFGPRQQITSPSLGILNFFIGQALKGEKITIYGEGNQLRDYNFVENAIDALLLCATNDKAKGEIFYLGSNKGVKFKDMANTIIDIVGKGEIQYIPYPSTAKKIEIGDFIVDFSKLKNLLEWEPKVSFKEGIEITVEFYRNHLEYLEN